MAKSENWPIDGENGIYETGTWLRTSTSGWDTFSNLAQILSTKENNLFEYKTKDGKSLEKGLEFIYPYIVDKSKWPYQKDIYIWSEWSSCHSSLIFTAIAYNNNNLNTYLNQQQYPIKNEVIRNLAVRHPKIWII